MASSDRQEAAQSAAGPGASTQLAMRAAAARGAATSPTQLPFADLIQRAFGRHDISSVQAHVGRDAAAAARELGAGAYATGNHVVLGDRSDLFTVAHEAAHVIQQRSGVQLEGAMGSSEDRYEQHANEIASLVVQGKSAEKALDAHAGPCTSSTADHAGAIVQCYTIVKPRLPSAMAGDRGHDEPRKQDEKRKGEPEPDSPDTLEDGQDGVPGYRTRPASGDGAPAMFPWQEYAHVTDQERHSAAVVEQTSNTPPLRVAEQGHMAIEHGPREPCMFYASPEVIARSNTRLEDVGSPIALDRHGVGHKLGVPVDPRRPWSADNTRWLDAVVPKERDASDPSASFRVVHECSILASHLLGQRDETSGIATFQVEARDDKRAYSRVAYTQEMDQDSPGRIAEFAATRRGGVGALSRHLAGDGANANGPRADESSDEEVEAVPPIIELPEFVTQAHQVGAISEPGMGQFARVRFAPRRVRERIFADLAAWLKHKPGQQLKGEQVSNIIRRHWSIATAIPYGRMMKYNALADRSAHGAQRSRKLGINQYAVPEVGEAFATFSVDLMGLRFTGGEDERCSLDISGESKKDGRRLDKEMQNLDRREMDAEGMVEVAVSAYTNLKRFWNWHFATVVARVGGDSVTLENYNRARGKSNALESIYHELLGELKTSKVDKRRRKELGRDQNPADRRKIPSLVAALSEALGKEIPDMQRVARADSWYFQMYGSADQSRGDDVDQSFHSAGTDYVNPLTLRIAAPADDRYKRVMIGKLEDLLAARLFVPGIDQGRLCHIRDIGVTRIRAAITRTQVAEVYRAADEQMSQCAARPIKRYRKAMLGHRPGGS